MSQKTLSLEQIMVVDAGKYKELANANGEQPFREIAVYLLTEAIKIDSQNPNTLNLRGNVLYESGKLEEAVSDYSASLALRPHSVVHRNLGKALAELGKPYDALNQYLASLELKPDSEVYLKYGDTLVKLSRFEEAIEAFTESIRMNPKDYEARVLRANSLSITGDYEDAIKDFEKAKKIEETAEVHLGLGVQYFGLGDFSKSKREFSKAIRKGADKCKPLISRAFDYILEGDNRNAIHDLDTALAIHEPNSANESKGDHSLAYTLRALAYAHEGDFDKAREDMGRSAELKPNADLFTYIHFVLGDICRLNGSPDLATSEYQDVIGKITNTPSKDRFMSHYIWGIMAEKGLELTGGNCPYSIRGEALRRGIFTPDVASQITQYLR